MDNTNYITLYLKARKISILKKVISAMIITCFCLAAVFLFRKLAADNIRSQSLKSVKEAVEQCAVQCYAIEGVYPSSLSYLEENYGLIINKDEYVVSYEAFSSNLMPSVTVLVKGE